MSRLGEIFNKMTEDADAGTTSAGDIADVRTRLPIGTTERPKKKKKKNPLYRDSGMLFRALEAMADLKETATAGSTGTTTFSGNSGADFGTDTPRIPSELGDLTGEKSHGMWGGVEEITYATMNAYVAARDKKTRITPEQADGYEAYEPLNDDGYDRLIKNKGHYGDSTTTAPVQKSPFDTFVPSGEFVLSKDRADAIAGRAGVKKEQERRELNHKLRLLAQANFINALKGLDITQDTQALERLIRQIRANDEEDVPELEDDSEDTGAKL